MLNSSTHLPVLQHCVLPRLWQPIIWRSAQHDAIGDACYTYCVQGGTLDRGLQFTLGATYIHFQRLSREGCERNFSYKMFNRHP